MRTIRELVRSEIAKSSGFTEQTCDNILDAAAPMMTDIDWGRDCLSINTTSESLIISHTKRAAARSEQKEPFPLWWVMLRELYGIDLPGDAEE